MLLIPRLSPEEWTTCSPGMAMARAKVAVITIQRRRTNELVIYHGIYDHPYYLMTWFRERVMCTRLRLFSAMFADSHPPTTTIPLQSLCSTARYFFHIPGIRKRAGSMKRKPKKAWDAVKSSGKEKPWMPRAQRFNMDRHTLRAKKAGRTIKARRDFPFTIFTNI